MSSEPNYMKAGEAIVIDIRSGDEKMAWEAVVAEPCTESLGYWYCDTCRESAANNIGIASCADSGHRLAWICYRHGPEQAITP